MLEVLGHSGALFVLVRRFYFHEQKLRTNNWVGRERKWRGERERKWREREHQKNRCQRSQGARPIAPGQQGFLRVLLIVCTWLPPCHLQQMTNTYLLSERLSDSNLKEMAWSEHQFQTEFILSISSPGTLQSQPLTVMGGSSTDLLMLW